MQPSRSSSIRPALALLQKTPVLLETMLADLSFDLLRWKPTPDRWSISEVLSHLADAEELFADRVRRFVVEDSPLLKKHEQPSEGYSQGTEQEHLSRFTCARREILQFLNAAPPEIATRTAVHSEIGKITLEQMLNEWASHDLGHVRQIAELYRAYAFYPNSGPFQRYSNLRP